MPFAAVFPGQGSQSPGMLSGFDSPLIREVFSEASDTLSLDLWGLAQHGPEEELNRTENTQPVMLAAGVAVWRLWESQGGCQPVVMAGHSLGEYSALVCSGALDFADAVRLVAARGRLMQSAVPDGAGAMAAILGLDDDAVRAACDAATQGEVVSPVNFNSPGQVVIAGAAAAVDRACAAAKDAGAKRALKLPVSVPSHCSLMEPAARELAQLLADVEISTPRIPVIHNVNVATLTDPSGIRDALAQQLYNPVRWVETVRRMAGQGVDRLVEFGPGKVLAGLTRRIDRSLNAICIHDAASLDAALASCEGESS